MTEDFSGWLYEAGIGENRAALIEHGEMVRVRIEREISSQRVGAVLDAKFSKLWVAGQSGIVTLPSGQEALLQPLPNGLTEGAEVRVELIRQAITEKHGQYKRAKVKPAAPGAQLQAGLSLLQELKAGEFPVRPVDPHQDDLLRQYGWHGVLEQADTGHVDFDGGSLLISLTPAMTVIDVDGPLPAIELAKRAAKEIAHSLTRLDITGNIGVDFPTLEAKAERNAVVQIFDDQMSGNCERTAINGFGFMQIISRKVRPSVLEILQSQRVKTAALQLVRQAERTRGTGAMTLAVHPALMTQFSQHPEWLDELAKRMGRAVNVEVSGKIPIGGGLVS